MEAEDNNILTLLDGEGNEVDFALLDLIPYLGRDFAVFYPLEEEGDEKELVILELKEGETGEDSFVGLSDADLLDAVYALFLERNA
jgi:uncharacterized protein YrzB (UPF0473 family)